MRILIAGASGAIGRALVRRLRANPHENLRDANELARAETAKKKADRRFTDELGRLPPVLFDPGHVDMGDEIVGIATPEHEYLGGVIGLGLLYERNQIAHQFCP